MHNSIFKNLRVLLALLLLLGFSSIFVLNSTWADVVDQRIAEIQKQIDQKGYCWKAGRNWVSELPLEEARKLLGHNPPKDYEIWLEQQPKLTAGLDLLFPSYFDWRDSGIVTPVKNQGGCGSCWDFSATGAFEANVKKHDGIEYDLSEQQVLSCNIYEAGCDGGWAEPVYELFKRYGAVSESCMPYQAKDYIPCTQEECDVVVKLKDWAYVDTSVNAIKTALLQGPVHSCFSVYDDFFSYDSGCYQWASGGYAGGHCIVIVGWDDSECDGEGAWICKNSWGPGWGSLGGYFKIKWGNCGIGRSTVLPLYPPDPVELVYEDKSAWETGGNGNGCFDPAETVTVSVDLKNVQVDTATGVQATLRTTYPGINLIDSVVTFSDISLHQVVTSSSPHFSFEIDSTVANAERVDFDLAISCAQGSFNAGFYLFVGNFDTAFADDMEGDDNGWTHDYYILEDDWEHGAPQVGSRTDPTYAYSGSKVWGNDLNDNYPGDAHNYLISPVINCQRFEKTRLWLYRWLAVEKSLYDSAAIYVNDNLVWVNDYDWDHIDFKWTHHDLDISAYADSAESVQVRFEIKTDVGLHLGGWSIDDFAIVGVQKYLAGDADGNGEVQIQDAVYLVNYIFKSGPEPAPVESGDSNCDGECEVSDVVYLINYLFRSGPEPCA
ncbi:MAG: C1 family peptidase [Candidatus Zixiibacteriota bacterium]